MLKTDTIQITPELLTLISEIDEFKVSLNTSKCTTNVRIKVHHLSGVFGYWI